jgi:cAMP-specific phosphodiesterase 4
MLGEIDRWGIDIFRIGDLSNNRPLTAVAYAAFQVMEQFKYQNDLQNEIN